MNNYKKYKELINLANDNRYKIILGSIFSGIISVLSLLEPLLGKWLIDICIVDRKIDFLKYFIIIYIIIFITQKSLTYLKNYLFFISSERMLFNLKMNIHNVMIYDINMNTEKRKSIISHITNELQSISSVITIIFDNCIANFVSLSVIVIYLFKFNYIFIIAMMFIILLMIVILKYFSPKVKIIKKGLLDSFANSLDLLNQNFNNIKLINYIKIYSFSEKKASEAFKLEIKNKLNKLKINIKTDLSFSVLYFIPIVLVYYVGVYLIYNEMASLGSLYLLINYITKIISPISFFSNVFVEFQSISVVIDRYLNIVNNKKNNVSKLSKEIFEKNIEVKDIDFYYSDKKILNKFNMNIESKNKYIITGKNGSGKSTLIEILLGIRKPTNGCIKIDGKHISDIDTSSLISISPQDHFLFNTTVKENIILGRNISEDNIFRVIDELDLSNIFNESFNVDTIIRKNGENLSGGQKQIISILRALVVDSDIIILDEPFNHLDKETKDKLINFLEKYKNTIIIVSHQNIYSDYNEITI